MIIRRLMRFALLGLFLNVPAVHAGTDAYVDAVRAEVDEFTTGRFEPPAGSSWVVEDGSSVGFDGTANLSDFDAFLRGKLPGTYILYARLPTWKKQQLFDEYNQTGDLGKLRSGIMRGGRGPALRNLPTDF